MNKTSLIETRSDPLIMDLPFSDGEYQRRLDGCRELMNEKGVDAFVSFTPENIYYLTGHDTPGYYYLQACVVTHDHDPVVFTRKIESFNTLGRSWKRKTCPYGDTDNPVTVLSALLGELGCENKCIGLESDAWFITSAQYLELNESLQRSGQVTDASGLVENLRMIKSEEELAYIRQAGKICSAAMHSAFEASHDGANENDVAAATLAKLAGLGGEYAGLPPFISTGPRTTLVHSTWAGRTMVEGDVLAYEIPGVRARYCAALYRTGVIGNPSDDIQRGCGILLELLEELLHALKPGRPINEIHHVTLEVFRRHNFPAAPRRSAYALGINYPPDWGEGHIISFTEKETRPLQPGMVFHAGTGIYEYPLYQLAFSESVIITDNGYELVTDFPREITIR